MDFVQQENRTLVSEIAMSVTPAAADAPPVYNPTTIPLHDLSSNGNGSSTNGKHEMSSMQEKEKLKTFSNLPERTPVDIQFKDITYTVNVGFRKG